MTTQRRSWRALGVIFALALVAAACGNDDDGVADPGDPDDAIAFEDVVDIYDMAAYLEQNSDAIVCMESEFPDRSDGLVLFEEATGFTIPQGQTLIMDLDLIYNETAQGNCAFGEIFTTDGRIPFLDLQVIEDDDVFIIYNVSVNVRDEVYQQAPEAFDTIADRLLEGLDNDTMAELNRLVSVEGEEASDVAGDYLSDEGLLEEFEGLDLAGVSITVGSKDFTEQLVLGEMMVQAFEAAGANVTNRVNLGGTQVNRQALLEGEIHVYAEYNGTGWTEHLGNTDPSDDPETLTENVRQQDLEDNGIHWLGRSPFNNTYGFARAS